MSLLLATILAIDSAAQDDQILYPNLTKPRPAQERRQIYWKTVNVFCATARRCYPDAHLCVITNDPDDLSIDGVLVSQLLGRLGVERCFLPFAEFKPPPGSSKKFLNNFYRLDAIQYLANAGGRAEDGILLFDSDIVCAHGVPEIEGLIPEQGMWSFSHFGEQDPYQLNLENLSRAQMGETFRALDATYPNSYPIWYSGEFIGGRRAAFQQLVGEMKRVWAMLLERAIRPLICFANGESFFDNDEYILSYIYSRGELPITSAGAFCRRMTTLEGVRNIMPGDEMFPVWHVFSEKRRGLALLFTQMLDPNSLFWKTDPNHFYRYLGDYLGVPNRRYDVSYTAGEQLERYARIGARWLRRKRKPMLYSHSGSHS